MVGPNMSNIQRFPCTFWHGTVCYDCVCVQGLVGMRRRGRNATVKGQTTTREEVSSKPPDEVRISHHILCKCNTKTAWNWLNEV